MIKVSLGLLCLALLLGAGAGAVRAIASTTHDSSWAWLGVALLWCGVAIWASVAIDRWRSVPARLRILLLLGVGLVVRVMLVYWHHDLPLAADRRYLADFVSQWSAHGEAGLRGLSTTVYDYREWAGRSWPLLRPVRDLFPSCFVAVTLYAQVALATILHALLTLVCWRTRGPRLALWVCAWALFCPPLIWAPLEYGYLIMGATLLTSSLLLMFSLASMPKGSPVRYMLTNCLLAALLSLLNLQRGLDLVLLAAASITVCIVHGPKLGPLARMVIWPLLISAPLTLSANAYIERHNVGKLSSGLIAHMAWGWNTVTWGEFYGPVMQMDRDAAQEDKKRLMIDYMRDQVRSRPFEVLVKLPLIKAIKLFQIGAASGAEEALAARPPWAGIVRMTRLVYSPITLLAAAVGAWVLSRRRLVYSDLLPPLCVLGLMVAYTLFSEVSPRYAIYLLFALLPLAASGFEALMVFMSDRAGQKTNA